MIQQRHRPKSIFLNPLNCISYYFWQVRWLDNSILNAYWKSDFASRLFLPLYLKEQHIFPRLVMIQPQDFSADLICRRTPAESDKWAFTSRDRCSLQNHLLPSLLSLHRLLFHLHLPPSSIFSTPGQLCPLIRSCLMLQMDQWQKVSELKMHHLFSLFVKRHLPASNAGELWRWMCVSHRPLSRPPEERVILLLSRVCVCVCLCVHVRNSVFLHRLRLKLWYSLISRRKPLESCYVPPRHGPITGFNQ